MVAKNLVGTVSLIIRVDQEHENSYVKFLNKHQDVLNEGKKKATPEILPFMVNLEKLVQLKSILCKSK